MDCYYCTFTAFCHQTSICFCHFKLFDSKVYTTKMTFIEDTVTEHPHLNSYRNNHNKRGNTPLKPHSRNQKVLKVHFWIEVVTRTFLSLIPLDMHAVGWFGWFPLTRMLLASQSFSLSAPHSISPMLSSSFSNSSLSGWIRYLRSVCSCVTPNASLHALPPRSPHGTMLLTVCFLGDPPMQHLSTAAGMLL